MGKDWVRDAARLPGTKLNRCPSLLLPRFGSFSFLRGQVVYLRNVRRKAQDGLPLGALPSSQPRLLPVCSVSGGPSHRVVLSFPGAEQTSVLPSQVYGKGMDGRWGSILHLCRWG